MATVTKKRKRSTSKAPAAIPPDRKVYEVYSGKDLEFDGCIVVQEINGVKLILGWAQSKGAVQPYESDAELEADHKLMLEVAYKGARDIDFIGRGGHFIDFTGMGRPDSKKRMFDEAYEWRLYEPNAGPHTKHGAKTDRQIFPYCPIRFAEMEAQRAALVKHFGAPEKGHTMLPFPADAAAPSSQPAEDAGKSVFAHDGEGFAFKIGDVEWTVHEGIAGLTLIGDEEDKEDAVIVVDPFTRRILIGQEFTHANFGSAILKAIELSEEGKTY